MPFLEFFPHRLPGEKERVYFEGKKSVKQILDLTDVRVRSGCSGIGACGLCKVRQLTPSPPPPSVYEELHLSAEELCNGARLACRLYPTEDTLIEVLSVAAKSVWRSDVISGYKCEFETNKINGYRLAVDIGTTHIGVAIADEKGFLVADRIGLNPQGYLGADVLSRLSTVIKDKELGEKGFEATLNAIAEAAEDIKKREGISHKQILSCDIVANTAMLAIFAGNNCEKPLNPAYWNKPIQIEITSERKERVLKKLRVESLTMWAPFAGFVGSDAAAGVVHTRLMSLDKPSMLIDFGTNSEIALWDGKRLFLTSAAGGPAFEASGVGCGMPAVKGAVFRACKQNGEWGFETIGDAPPEGVCGSGLVDIIASMLKTEEINPMGVFKDGSLYSEQFFAQSCFYVSKRDIDMFARAKSAIFVGAAALCEEAGVDMKKLEVLYIGGDFGKYIDVQNAVDVGLIPPLCPSKVKAMGNTALLGCLDLALSDFAKEEFYKAQALFKVINLASYENFDEAYMQNLYLRRAV